MEGVPAGDSYLANLKAKGLAFAPGVVVVPDTIDGLDFTAEP